MPKSGEFKSGEGRTGDEVFSGKVLEAAVQNWGWDTPAASISLGGAKTLSADVQNWGWATPTATIGSTNWIIDGDGVETPRNERVTWKSLELEFRVTSSVLTDTFRPLKLNEGQVDVVFTDSGGYTAIDKADGGNTFEITPPVGRQPLRRDTEYHVERYEEKLADEDIDAWTVELELIPTSNRTDSPSLSQSPTGDEWGFQTRLGEISTIHVDAEFLGRGQGGVKRFALTMRLRFEQAYVFEAALNQMAGVRVRAISGARNVAVDNSSSAGSTITVDSPTEDEVTDGDYIVLEWESKRLSGAAQEFSLEMALSKPVEQAGTLGGSRYGYFILGE